MLHVGYRIAKDQQSLLSYSFNGNVMTIDPVSTSNPGWKQFLVDSRTNGQPAGRRSTPQSDLWILSEQARKALGERLTTVALKRAEFDPDNRLLNDFFRNLFGPAATVPGEQAARPSAARKAAASGKRTKP